MTPRPHVRWLVGSLAPGRLAWLRFAFIPVAAWAMLDASNAFGAGADAASPASRLRTSAAPCTVWIGHVVGATGLPGTPGGATPWHLGRGANRIIGGGAAGTPANSFNGAWCFDHFQAGDDSLMGWWPVVLPYASAEGASVADRARPFFGLDYGNQGNYAINMGAPKRTFGVLGYWHRDPGSGLAPSAVAGTNPAPLLWAPLAGAASAWCGLRSHGDAAVVDPVTHNPFNQSVLDYNGSNRGFDGPSGTASVAKNFPGYGSQWDQMLYRDVVIGSDGVNLTVSFKYRTALSTGYLADAATRVGWFDKDPLKGPTPSDGNFISSTDAWGSTPVDSFMVYVGVPMDTSSGIARYQGSDGFLYSLYDRQRRWFSEVIRINKPYVEVLTKAGTNATTTFSVTLPNSSVQPILNAQPGVGGTVRVVFRVKTNRGFDDEDNGTSGFSSGTAGAAIVDDVNLNTGGGNLVTNGDFEAVGAIDNNPATLPTAAWKSTGKPPGVFFHAHDLFNGPLPYYDPFGFLGSPNRICNLFGKIVTPGNHDQNDKPGGNFGTVFQDRQDALVSPTINLVSSGVGSYNAMGIDADAAAATSGYALWFDALTNLFDYPNTGNGYRIGWQSYPATQPNGVKCWGDIQKTTYFSTGVQGCYSGFLGGSPGALAKSLIVTSNASGVPDSIRVYVEHIARCYTLPINNVTCSPDDGINAGGYFDNLSIALIDLCPGTSKNVNVSANGVVDPVGGHPDISSTTGDILVAAWGRLGNRVSFSRSRSGGAMFSRARQLNQPASQPALARTPTGFSPAALFLASADASAVSCSRSTDDGVSFYTAVPIPNSAQAANPAIAVDPSGRVHVVWDGSSSTIYYSKSADGVLPFGSGVAISGNEAVDRHHVRPDIAVDNLQDLYAVWNHTRVTGSPEDWIQLSLSTDHGGTFSASPVTISDTGRLAHDPQILAGAGVVYAVWVYAGSPDMVHLASAPSGSTTFTTLTDVAIPGDGGGTTHNLSAAISSAGALYVVVQASVSGNQECFYFTRPSGGGSFTTPVDISNSAGPSLAPTITLDSSGAPVIVWSDQFGGGQDVFCTHP